MSAKHKTIIVSLFFLAMIALGIFYSAHHDIIILDPKGFIAHHQKSLIYISSALMLLVVIPVFIMTLYFAWKFRETNKEAKYTPEWNHSYAAEAVWWGVPFVIILVLAIITWQSSHSLSPFKPLKSDKPALHIQAVALEWRWLFIYPEQNIATINAVQFPADRPVTFEITADAPMNSFWIPQLGGQIYAMPAMRSTLHLIADEPGEFVGKSSNFSGSGFSGMTFTATATSEDDFDRWVSKVKSAGKTLDFKDYQKLVTPTSNSPVTYFRLADGDLFEQIMMQYEPPIEK